MQEKFKNKLKLNIVIQIILFIILIVIDRITKIIVTNNLKGQDAVPIIEDVLELRYLENSGAAFGMFQNMQWMFYIVTAIILVLVVFLFVSIYRNSIGYTDLISTDPDSFHFRTFYGSIFLNYLLVVLAAGAVGNLIDRLTTVYVVDFIYFKLIDFPIFNFADICVTLSAAFLIIFFIFIYRDDKNFSIFGSKKQQ